MPSIRCVSLCLSVIACASCARSVYSRPTTRACSVDAPDPSAPESMEKDVFLGVMGEVRRDVQTCFDGYRQPGNALVHMSVCSSGVVSSAEVKGELTATATAECIE